MLARNPYEGQNLLGDLAGRYFYRLTFKDRMEYGLHEKRRIIYIERAKTQLGE